MDTELLKTFLNVAKLKSFTLAAKELQLTQPALSKRLKRLEQIIGTNLFDRFGNQINLTEAGRLLQSKAPVLLSEIEKSMQQIRDLSGRVSGQLSIATSHYIGLHHLPTYLEQYIEQYPNIDLNIDFIDSGLAYQKVLRGEIELALVTFPEQKDPRLVHQKVWREQMQISCHQEHQLTKQSEPIKHLANYPCILPPAHTFPRDLFEHHLQQLGVSPNKVKTANYFEVIGKLVACKMGWSLLPEQLIKPPLTVLNIEDNSSSREMGIIYRNNKSLSNAGQALQKIFIHNEKPLSC